MAYLYLLMVVWVVLQVFWPANPSALWAVEALVFRLLLLLVLRKQLLCAFVSLILHLTFISNTGNTPTTGKGIIPHKKVTERKAHNNDRLCGLVVRVLDYRFRGPGFDSRHYKKKVVGLERGPLSLVSTTEELLDRKVAAPVSKTENKENRE
jgi:hypothetical protein